MARPGERVESRTLDLLMLRSTACLSASAIRRRATISVTELRALVHHRDARHGRRQLARHAQLKRQPQGGAIECRARGRHADAVWTHAWQPLWRGAFFRVSAWPATCGADPARGRTGAGCSSDGTLTA